jgi:NAD(P)-dependent dehydrogenase (short-subunit alcohol dehydrogenase family)
MAPTCLWMAETPFANLTRVTLAEQQATIMKLNNKVAVITGAARGIGKAIAERYVNEGAKVVIADLNEQGADAVAVALGPNAVGCKLDVTDQTSIDAMVAAAVSRFGGIDILVNNAGLFDLAPIIEITRESYRRVYAVNVEGLLFTLQAVAKRMISQGRGGKIINFASQAGGRGEPLVAVYCSSKAAVISLTQSAGLDLIKHRINVNGIAPGVVDNEHWDHVDAMFAKYENLKPGEKKHIVGASAPYGRMARPEEIGGLATFLASEDADYIVAPTYHIDGGNWMN